MRQVGSVVFWLFVVISSIPLTAIAFVIWLVTMPFDKRRVVLHRFTCFWASLYTWTNPAWPVTITGREHIEAGRTYVLVANHLSLLDILVLFRLFKDFKWVSKAEIFKVPGVGWNMRWNKYIPLKRGDRESIAEMMAASEETLRSGSSIMIFPEGTRSKTGELKDFKRGAFDMARDTDCAIVPIVIRGVDRDAVEPGEKGALAAETRQSTVSLDERLLHDVLYLVGIPDEACHQRIDPVLVFQHQHVEGAVVALLHAFDELLITLLPGKHRRTPFDPGFSPLATRHASPAIEGHREGQ